MFESIMITYAMRCGGGARSYSGIGGPAKPSWPATAVCGGTASGVQQKQQTEPDKHIFILPATKQTAAPAVSRAPCLAKGRSEHPGTSPPSRRLACSVMVRVTVQ
jgi:hypothetical protein